MTCCFDHVDLTTHLKAFVRQSNVSNKTGLKIIEMHRFSCRVLLVQIKCKTCHFDRVDLTTRVNTIICQSDILNKIRLKTLKVHRFLCRDFCFRILSHETPNGYYEWNVDHKMWCNVRRLVSHSLTELACDLNLKKEKKNTHIYQNLLGFHLA